MRSLNCWSKPIPLSANETQAVVNAVGANNIQAILNQTISQKSDTAALALGIQQSFANTKDAVQNVGALLANAISNVNQNVSDQGCQTREVVQATATQILSRIDANTIAELQAELAESRGRGRARETEVNVTQTVNQNQQQAQFQVQLQDIGRGLNRLADSHQDIRQGLVNLGTMVGTTQSAANTRVA